MPVYNLPPVTKEGLAEPKSGGDWFAIPNLGSLARSLRLDKAPVRVDELKSIPDAWAQAQLTTDAFFDEDHDAHEDVIAQWRGLLATLALQPRYAAEYDLKVEILDLTDTTTPSKFREVLQKLLPKPSASLGLGWDKLGIVKFIDRSASLSDELALAFLSPSSLIAPGRMVSQFSKRSIPWLIDGVSDPLRVQGLAAEDIAILQRYLAGLIEAVRDRVSPDMKVDKRDVLLAQLSAYLDGLSQHQRKSLPTTGTDLRLVWPDPFFKVLGRTQELDTKAIAPNESDCLVSASAGKAAGLYRGIILVDEAIAETLNRPSSDVRVWKQFTLRDASSQASFKRMRDDAHAEGYLILQRDDLFTDRLVRLDEGAEIPANPSSLQNALMPLSPIALLLKGWGDEAELSEKGDIFSFSIQVELQRSGTRHRVARTFNSSDTLTLSPPTDLAVWPNFQADDWPWTFLRFQYDPRSELMTRFAASSDFIASSIASDDKRKKLRNAEEWAAGDSLAFDRRLNTYSLSTERDAEGRLLLERFRFRNSAQLVGEQHRLPHGADAIFFAVRDEAANADVPVGCVKLFTNDAPQSVDSAKVAFDFGTTNTIAYSKRGSEPPRRVNFKDRVVQPILTEGGKEEVAATYTDFFPVNEHETPVPTIAKKREFGKGALPQDIRQALNDRSDMFGLSHMVFFMPRGGATDTPEYMLGVINEGLLQFEIKWGKSADDRQLVQSFLKQLMIMVAAELRADGLPVENIKWRYSYPQAFSSHHKQAFQDIIRNAWTSLAQDNDAIGSVAQNITFSTEADAAMRYFTMDKRQERLGVGRLVVMFDIGGGTSDIAIWKEQELLWRGSARLAGTHFFNSYLANNLSVLEAIDRGAVRAFQNAVHDNDLVDKSYRARQLVELIIARQDFADRFDAAYPMHSGEAEWAGLRQVAKTALAGLHHYVGLVLTRLKGEGRLDDIDIKELTIALGGRGSTIFRRFVSDGDARDLTAVAQLIGMTSDTLAPPDTIEPRFSELPKEEVARGLLLDPTSGPSDKAAVQFEPLGLRVVTRARGETLEHEPDADTSSLGGASQVKEVDLGELKRFIANLAAATGLQIGFEGREAESNVQLRTRSHLKEQLAQLPQAGQDSSDTQDLEAPFITALRYLIGVMSSSISERDGLLSTKERQ